LGAWGKFSIVLFFSKVEEYTTFIMADIYVDESGDLGQNGERYFVIALIVAQKQERIKNIVKHFCASTNVAEIKASLLSFPQKQTLINKLCSVDDHSISYIVVDKNHISNMKLFEDKNLIYNYIFQHLIKPIIKSSSGDLEIILDNHTVKVKSVNSLSEYIKIKAYAEWNVTSNIHIRYMDSRHCKLLQMADVIANCIYGHYLYKKNNLYGLLRLDRSIKFPNGKFNT